MNEELKAMLADTENVKAELESAFGALWLFRKKNSELFDLWVCSEMIMTSINAFQNAVNEYIDKHKEDNSNG